MGNTMNSKMISSVKLKSGESIALGAIGIKTIPHVSIIDGGADSPQNVVEQYKKEFSALLKEVYQIYRASGFSDEISMETLWLTEPVVNQPYAASICLYILIRAISQDGDRACRLTSEIGTLFQNTLTAQKYEIAEVGYPELAEKIRSVNDDACLAVVKDETAQNLQNSMLPYCYSFDRLPVSDQDLSRIVNALIQYPNCALSFALTPTRYQLNERSELDRVTQALDTLYRGVADQSLGNVSFALAKQSAENYAYYSGMKDMPLFAFSVLIMGEQQAANSISSKVFSQLSSGRDNSANLKIIPIPRENVRKDTNFYPLPWALQEQLLHLQRNNAIWNSGTFSNALYRLPYIISAEESSEFFRLPVGGGSLLAGLEINDSGKNTKTYSDKVINSGDITVGKLRASSNGDTIGFSLKDLAKHMLVVGTPGSGKTTFSVSLLDRLWKEHHIPFLVIEPAKNEYRALVQSIPELQVFTPGKNHISPFLFNPFIPPKNVKLETYKSTLKTAFSAAVSMSTPLDKIFEESVNNCYSDFRWLDTYTSDDKGRIFNISDFIKCFQQTFDEIGYTGDAKNIGRAGVVRLNSLVNLFDNYGSIPIEDLLEKPTVIELAAIENADQKALIIALLLLSILAYVNANYVGEGGLKNVILLEEAHVLLNADTNAGQGEANPSAIAQGLVKRMLAEIRSYGVGLVIADQSPRKVSADVVALTDMKMVFRLVESSDKQIIADSTNMSEAQVQRMSRLKPGEAFLFFNKLDEPEEVITPDYRLENSISISLSDDGIRSLSTYWDDKAERLRPYPQCAYCRDCRARCDYSRRMLAREIARRIFVRNFKADTKDFAVVLDVFKKISRLVADELNDEPFTPELLACVKVHLWRKIMYGTKIPVKEIQIENSVKK